MRWLHPQGSLDPQALCEVGSQEKSLEEEPKGPWPKEEPEARLLVEELGWGFLGVFQPTKSSTCACGPRSSCIPPRKGLWLF